MTTLNNAARLAIIESVIEKGTTIPAERQAIFDDTAKVARAFMLRQLPKDFEAATKILPPEWFNTCSATPDLRADSHPCSILKRLAKGESHRTYGNSIKFEAFRVPYSFRVDVWHHAPRNDDERERFKEADGLWPDILKSQIAAALKLRAKEDALRAELRDFLSSCRTYKQVLEKAPQLERHLPPVATKPMPLVVSTTAMNSLLKKAGFDQSVKA